MWDKQRSPSPANTPAVNLSGTDLKSVIRDEPPNYGSPCCHLFLYEALFGDQDAFLLVYLVGVYDADVVSSGENEPSADKVEQVEMSYSPVAAIGAYKRPSAEMVKEHEAQSIKGGISCRRLGFLYNTVINQVTKLSSQQPKYFRVSI